MDILPSTERVTEMGADPGERKINRQLISKLEMSIGHLDTDAREQLGM